MALRYSDRPIRRPGEDLLGRSSFALELARAVDGLSVAEEGFVMALLGEWGSGKTSVLRMMVRYLRHIEMVRANKQHRILPDDSTIEQLELMSSDFEIVEHLITNKQNANLDVHKWNDAHRLHEFARCTGAADAAQRADEYWRLKAQTDARLRTTVVTFSPWMVAGRVELASALLSELARALGASFGAKVRESFASILERLTELAPFAGAALGILTGLPIGSLAGASGDLAGKYAQRMSKGPTLEELRERLREVLSELGDQRALIIVDDLDRLTPTEALEVVGLVKSLCDLPNLVYLLAYDERKLSQLLTRAIGKRNDDFLEKVVQYTVHMPPTLEEELTKMFDSDLTKILGAISDTDSKRLNGTWYYVFSHYIHTPRDVRRLANSVSVAFSGLSKSVDPVDLVLLEVLRLFEIDVYHWVRANLDELAE